MKGSKLAKELVAGDRLWTDDGVGLLVHKVWRDTAFDLLSDTLEEKEAVFYAFGSNGHQMWYWPNNTVEIVIPELRRRVTEATGATEADEQALIAAYGKTSDELADEAEAGYDI